MSETAGETVSVRVPKGLPDKLRAATGLPFSTLVRLTMNAYLERLTAERRLGEAKAARQQAARDIRDIVNKQELGESSHD